MTKYERLTNKVLATINEIKELTETIKKEYPVMTPMKFKDAIDALNSEHKLTFRVFFLDVWGNETDGFEVNDRSSCGTISLPRDFSDQDLIQELIESDILASFVGKVSEVFHIDGDDTLIMIDRKRDALPLLQLELQA